MISYHYLPGWVANLLHRQQCDLESNMRECEHAQRHREDADELLTTIEPVIRTRQFNETQAEHAWQGVDPPLVYGERDREASRESWEQIRADPELVAAVKQAFARLDKRHLSR